MPTGYTAAIKDGITFEQFVMRCARAMGALVMMRDEPLDAPIPERFEPSDYHAKAIKKAQEDLCWLRQMPDTEAERESEKEFQEALVRYERIHAKASDLRQKYHEMREKVLAWTPPSGEHEGFKNFMFTQITESIDFDCRTDYYETPEKLSASGWKAIKIAKAERDLAYHTEENAKEIERTEARNTWLRQLRESLKS
jgi:hypothetical protein